MKREPRAKQITTGSTRNSNSLKRFFTGSKKKLIAIIVIAVVVIALLLILVIPGIKNSIIKSALKSDIGAAIADEVIGDGYEKNVLDKDFDVSKVAINGGVKTPEGYKMIALLGVDARDEELRIGSRTDTIMLLSINENTGDIKMGSICRDAYLVDSVNQYNDYYIGKANAAYAIGGPEYALSMLNRNWDLAITDYVVVNFGGLANIIDAMGGITLQITNDEKDDMNFRMYEQIESFGGEYVEVEKSGEVHLNGAQATAFCRIRSVEFKNPLDGEIYEIDYGRTARQRYVVTELFRQAKSAGTNAFIKMINEVCDENVGDNKFIMTSLPVSDFVKLMGTLLDMHIAGQEAFPKDEFSYITTLDSGSSIVAYTLEKNMKLLHEFLLGEKSYTPSADFYRYEAMITGMVNLQKTGSADITFDPYGAESETWAAGDELVEENEVGAFTFEYNVEDGGAVYDDYENENYNTGAYVPDETAQSEYIPEQPEYITDEEIYTEAYTEEVITDPVIYEDEPVTDYEPADAPVDNPETYEAYE